MRTTEAVLIAALMAADVPAQTDFSLDVLPQALGPLLTRPKFWHLLGAALCALVCAKRLIQATTSDHICAQGLQAMQPRSQSGAVVIRTLRRLMSFSASAPPAAC